MLWPKPWTDQQMDVTIAMILRAGVIVSALTVLAGGVFYLGRYGFTLPDYRVFLGEPADLRSTRGSSQTPWPSAPGASFNSVSSC